MEVYNPLKIVEKVTELAPDRSFELIGSKTPYRNNQQRDEGNYSFNTFYTNGHQLLYLYPYTSTRKLRPSFFTKVCVYSMESGKYLGEYDIHPIPTDSYSYRYYYQPYIKVPGKRTPFASSRRESMGYVLLASLRLVRVNLHYLIILFIQKNLKLVILRM